MFAGRSYRSWVSSALAILPCESQRRTYAHQQIAIMVFYLYVHVCVAMICLLWLRCWALHPFVFTCAFNVAVEVRNFSLSKAQCLLLFCCHCCFHIDTLMLCVLVCLYLSNFSYFKEAPAACVCLCYQLWLWNEMQWLPTWRKQQNIVWIQNFFHQSIWWVHTYQH